MVDEVFVAAFRVPEKDPIDPKILGTRVRVQVCPLGVFRVGGRVDGVGPDMAEAARHPDAEGPHQILSFVVLRVIVILVGIPGLPGVLVKIGVGEEAHPDNPRGFSVIRTGGKPVRPARAKFHPRIFGFVGEGIFRATRPFDPFVKP